MAIVLMVCVTSLSDVFNASVLRGDPMDPLTRFERTGFNLVFVRAQSNSTTEIGILRPHSQHVNSD